MKAGLAIIVGLMMVGFSTLCAQAETISFRNAQAFGRQVAFHSGAPHSRRHYARHHFHHYARHFGSRRSVAAVVPGPDDPHPVYATPFRSPEAIAPDSAWVQNDSAWAGESPRPFARRHHVASLRGGGAGIRQLIAKHAAANGVPFALADAVVRIESGYQPHAAHGGALGLMQIKPATARGVGFGGSAAQLYTADTNLHFGMRYLAQAYRLSGGNVCATVMRYQSGTYANRMTAANRAYCSRAQNIMARN